MNSRHGIVIAAAVLLLQGCGGSQVEQSKPEGPDNQRIISTLKSELETARDFLTRQEAQNEQLNRELNTFRNRIGELEDELAKAQAEKKETAAKGPADQSRVNLLGAKALAESKAARLSERLDSLSRDMENKEKELAQIQQTATQKDQEIASLRATVEKLQRGDQTRSSEVDEKLGQLNKEAQARAAEAQRLKKELEDKTILFDTLKEAVTDAGRLKKTAEAEVARLQKELRDTSSKLEKSFADVEQLSGEVAGLKTELQKSQNEIARVRTLLDQTRQEKDHYHSEAAKFQLEGERLAKELQSVRAALDETNSRLQEAYTATEADRKLLADYQAAVDQYAENQKKLQTYLEQSQEDKVHYHEQATKLRIEVERRTEESQELRNQIADMTARMKELEQAAAATTPREEPESPSPMDRILGPPVKRGDSSDRPKGLF